MGCCAGSVMAPRTHRGERAARSRPRLGLRGVRLRQMGIRRLGAWVWAWACGIEVVDTRRCPWSTWSTWSAVCPTI
eukprot:2732979-Prymnesium_polylepis.1